MSPIRLINQRRQDLGLKWPRVTSAAIATIGVIDTSSITLSRWGWFASFSCPGGSDGCDKVLNSAWGTFAQFDGFNIPLSFIGLVAYLAVLLMAIFPLLPALPENKFELYRRTWWGIFVISCAMTVFSLLLLWLMLFKIEAFCFFCLLSALLSFSLLGLSVFGGGWDDFGELIFRGFIISISVLLGGLIWISSVDPNKTSVRLDENIGVPPVVQATSGPAEIALAKYLNLIGAVQYSAYWCPHCHDQKELFGMQAASELQVIECAEDGQNSQRSLCDLKGIQGFPTWEINGEFYSGVRSLDELSELSGYKGSRKFRNY